MAAEGGSTPLLVEDASFSSKEQALGNPLLPNIPDNDDTDPVETNEPKDDDPLESNAVKESNEQTDADPAEAQEAAATSEPPAKAETPVAPVAATLDAPSKTLSTMLSSWIVLNKKLFFFWPLCLIVTIVGTLISEEKRHFCHFEGQWCNALRYCNVEDQICIPHPAFYIVIFAGGVLISLAIFALLWLREFRLCKTISDEANKSRNGKSWIDRWKMDAALHQDPSLKELLAEGACPGAYNDSMEVSIITALGAILWQGWGWPFYCFLVATFAGFYNGFSHKWIGAVIPVWSLFLSLTGVWVIDGASTFKRYLAPSGDWGHATMLNSYLTLLGGPASSPFLGLAWLLIWIGLLGGSSDPRSCSEEQFFQDCGKDGLLYVSWRFYAIWGGPVVLLYCWLFFTLWHREFLILTVLKAKNPAWAAARRKLSWSARWRLDKSGAGEETGACQGAVLNQDKRCTIRLIGHLLWLLWGFPFYAFLVLQFMGWYGTSQIYCPLIVMFFVLTSVTGVWIGKDDHPHPSLIKLIW